MEPLSLPQDPLPSSLLLQGEKVSSQSSFELSSSAGVWLVGKGEKVRENEKEWEELKASRPKTLLVIKKVCYKVLFMAYILPRKRKITKMCELPTIT